MSDDIASTSIIQGSVLYHVRMCVSCLIANIPNAHINCPSTSFSRGQEPMNHRQLAIHISIWSSFAFLRASSWVQGRQHRHGTVGFPSRSCKDIFSHTCGRKSLPSLGLEPLVPACTLTFENNLYLHFI
jgi:hypothetical protein